MITALLLTAFAPAWWWALPACLVVVFGCDVIHNTLQVQATQLASERRGAAVATFAGAFFLGQSAGVGIAGLLVESAGTVWVLAACAWNFNRQWRILGHAT